MSHLTNAHADMYAEGVTSIIANLGAQNNFNQITAFANNGESMYMAPDHTNDHIVCEIAGHYICNVSISFSGSALETMDITVFKNNGTTAFPEVHATRRLGGGDIGSASLSGILTLVAGDTVEVWAACNSASNKSITIQDISLTLFKIE